MVNLINQNMEKKPICEIKKLEVHKDERGWLVELLKTSELEKPVKQVHIASLKPGYVRGNHYHSKRIEWFFLIAGKVKVVFQDVKTKEKDSFCLSEKTPKVITFFPYVSHAIKNSGDKTAYFISGQSDLYNPGKPDVFPWKIL